MKYRDELIDYDKAHGIKHNKLIKRAFKKQEYIESHPDVKYKPEKVEHVINFIESQFKQTKGHLKPIKLQPTQKWWLEVIFGYYDLNNNILINEIFINITRGAGKSTLMAAVVIAWMLLSDGYGGEGQVLAYDNHQADEVYGQVLRQLEAGGDVIQFLSKPEVVKIGKNAIKIPEQLHKTRDGILFRYNNNTFHKQTNDESQVQGGNTVLNIFDEIHTYRKQIVKPVNMGSRKQESWRSIYITSGGITRGGQYDDLIAQFTSDDDFHDLHTFSFIYKLDDASEVTDESAWTKAAPMIGVLPTWDKVRREYNEAKGNPALQIRFLAYDMGLQTQDAAVYFLQPAEVQPTEYDMNNVWQNAEAYLGIDVSYSGDWSSVAVLTFVAGKWYVHTENVTTRASIDTSPDDIKEKVRTFEGKGLTVIDADRIKAYDIYKVASNFLDTYSIKVLKIGYDRYNFDELSDLMEVYVPDPDNALQVPIRQGYYLSESTNLMKQLLQERRLVHNQAPLEWAFLNLTVKTGISGDIMIGKPSYYQKIDPVAALLFAMEVSK